jgi:pimeloyl-ACP methyl ester carboxylesterase
MRVSGTPYVALFERIPELTAADGEWQLMARDWTGRLRLGVGETVWDVSIDGGVVTAVDRAAGELPAVPGNAAYVATVQTWAAMLQPVPAPLFSDPAAAMLTGGAATKALFPAAEVGGDVVTARQYWPAVRRLVELLRETHSGHRAPPAPFTRSATAAFDAPVGRYVHLEVEGHDYRVYLEEAGEGIPLLLQHTAGADTRQWRHLFEDEELRSSFRMIAYDLPFHGKSLPPAGRRWWTEPYQLTKEFVMAVPRALSAALELDRPVFMGSSVGGQLAVDLAYHFPDEFRAVIGLESSLKQPEFFDPAMFWDPRVPSEFKAAFMLGLTAPTAPETLRRETWFVYSSGAPFTFAGDLNYWMIEHDLRHKAQDIDTSRCAVHLLTGEYDSATPPDMSRELAEQVEGATFTVMEGLGHFPMCEDPDRFMGYLRPIVADIADAMPTLQS